jgi:UDP-glucose 4-epimerase
VAAVKVLVTGGAGYIGSVTVRALEAAGHTPVVLDSLLTGPAVFVRGRPFYEGDVADPALLRRIVADHPDLGCTLHMAARTSVPESVSSPGTYYLDNVARSIELFQQLVLLGCPQVVFSSSAAVYAAPADGFEVHEDSPLGPSSPYARSKLMVEEVLEDLSAAGHLRAVVLRYFNPVGAAPDLSSGPHRRDPSDVLGLILAVATGRREHFTLTGTDLPTRDGSGLRDFVHVWDVARAHVAAVELLGGSRAPAHTVLNLGTGRGVTVRELVTTVREVSGLEVPTVEGASRPGDVVGAYAGVAKAGEVLGWRAELTLAEAVDSAVRWAAVRRQVLGFD